MTVRQDPSAPPVPHPVEAGLLSRALEVAGRLANDAAEVITATAGREHHDGAAPDTNPFDWVTDTDRTLERHTRRVLAAEFPGMPVVGEEYGDITEGRALAPRRAHPSDMQWAAPDAHRAPFRWVVKPVDGTANYVAGFPWCAYSLALVDTSGPVVGVIADPSRAQIYAAARGRGVRANGVPVRVVPRAPAGGLICAELDADRTASFTRHAAAGHAGIRSLGSPALAITQVALGHAVAAVLEGHREWDVAGAACLAVEAGAVIVDGRGNPDPLPREAMIVAVPGALDSVLAWWRATEA